jgi:integrase
VKYEYSLQASGRQERRIFETRDEAEAALDRRKREPREARIYGITPRTFADVVAEYSAYKASKGKKTVHENRALLEKQLIPFFGGNTEVLELTGSRIAQYEREAATRIHPRLGRPLSPSTVNRHLSVLRCVLRLARKWAYVREVPQFEMAREPEGRLRYLTRGEVDRLLVTCRQSRNPHLFAIVTLAVHTGMRKGEILGLTWDRVDFPRGILLLNETKSGKRREVPMSATVDSVLAELHVKLLKEAQSGPERPVFATETGSTWGRIDTAFSVALRRAGIEHFRFHDLRHTCASHLIMNGASLTEIKEILGHQDVKMTLRYAHLAERAGPLEGRGRPSR